MADLQKKYNFQDLLEQNPELYKQIISSLQLSGGMQSIANNHGIAGGGRVGLTLPVNDGDLNLGVSGSGYKVGKYKGMTLNNLDANYTKGQNSFGGDYNPQNRDFNVYYKRSF